MPALTPYDVLGVPPSATMAEIETRYRLLLRQCHPDLHHHEGAEAVQRAEVMTRNLNWAIAMIRRGRPPPPSSFPPPSATDTGPPGGWDRAGRKQDESNPDDIARRAYADWFGTPVEHRPNDPVPCPFCGRPYDRLDDYELHLEQVHRSRSITPTPPRPPSAFMTKIGKLRYVPAWLVVMLAFAVWAVLGHYYFIGALVVVLLVTWTQTSPRFRDR